MRKTNHQGTKGTKKHEGMQKPSRGKLGDEANASCYLTSFYWVRLCVLRALVVNFPNPSNTFILPHSPLKKATRRAQRDAWPILFPQSAD
jgi:hypothetical protein